MKKVATTECRTAAPQSPAPLGYCKVPAKWPHRSRALRLLSGPPWSRTKSAREAPRRQLQTLQRRERGPLPLPGHPDRIRRCQPQPWTARASPKCQNGLRSSPLRAQATVSSRSAPVYCAGLAGGSVSGLPHEKIRFQSFFMLTTFQPFAKAYSISSTGK